MAKKLHADMGLSLDRLLEVFESSRQEGYRQLLVCQNNGVTELVPANKALEETAVSQIVGKTLLFGLDTGLDLHDQIARLPNKFKFL